MSAVADTTPICYLILFGAIDVLPKLFGEVLLPPWISVKEDSGGNAVGMEKLQTGEQAAIPLTELLDADMILLDEKSARRVASKSRPAAHRHAGGFGRGGISRPPWI